MESKFISAKDTKDDERTKVANLLSQWNLSHLSDKFKKEKICTTALKYLSDADIRELIPEIGSRAIFRAALQTWRDKALTSNGNGTSEGSDEEATEDPLEIVDLNSPAQPDSSQNCENKDEVKEEVRNKVVPAPSDHMNEFKIREILQQSFDGRQVLEQYRLTHCLNRVSRGRMVRAVVNAVVEDKVNMTKEKFQKIAQGIVEVFPNEKIGTYYFSRCGVGKAKGSLYVRYCNMIRRSRFAP